MKSKPPKTSGQPEFRVTAFDIQYDIGKEDTLAAHLPSTLTFLVNAKTSKRIQADDDTVLADLITDATDVLVTCCCYRVERES